MLFGIVGTASAYDVNMEIFTNPNLFQYGPSDFGEGDISYSFMPSNTWDFNNVINITLRGKYADAKQWYNYGNSNEQAAWVRIPIIFDSVNAADFPNVNSKSTQWSGVSGKLIQQGTMVTINGVMYPVGVIKGRNAYETTTDRVMYNPFWTDQNPTSITASYLKKADGNSVGKPGSATGSTVAYTENGDPGEINPTTVGTGYVPASVASTPQANIVPLVNNGTVGVTYNDALGIIYSVKLQSGGCKETLEISYTPNGVEVYKATLNITYVDTASANTSVFVARETGDNAPNFTAKYDRVNGSDYLVFDTVLKSASMKSTSEKYYFRDAIANSYGAYPVRDNKSADLGLYPNNGRTSAAATNPTNYYDENPYTEFPTIVMTAKVQLRDNNGNPLPQRTQIRGSVDGKAVTAGIKYVSQHITDLTGLIAVDGKNLLSDTAAEFNGEVASNLFLFRAGDVYESTFGAATKTDDGYYLELDASGEFTATVRVIDNSAPLYKALLDDFITQAVTPRNGTDVNNRFGTLAAFTGAQNFTMKPYAVPLENVLVKSAYNNGADVITLEGIKNRVNYKYASVSQNVYTYSMSNFMQLKYDIRLNSLDRISAKTLTISGNTTDLLAVGATRQLQANFSDSSNPTDRGVTWKSSNPAVATVNATTGLVTAVSNGTAGITATDGLSTLFDVVTVTVGTPVAPTPEITAPTTTQYFVAVGSGSSLNVRSGASTSSARVGRMKRGEVVNVYEIVDGWAKIDYNGSIAYVSSRYISQ